MILFPYQKIGSEWLQTKKFALLADEMGLGKTAQAIIAADNINAERILVICPAVARQNWLLEFKKFSKQLRNWTVLTQSTQSTSSDCVAVSYDLAHLNLKVLKRPWDLVILDEAHYLKNHSAKRTKAILGKEGIAHTAKRVWALTGTPTPNNPSELWPLLYTIGATKLPYDKFVKQYCTYRMASYGLQIYGAKQSAIPNLKRILSPILLRRRKAEVMKDLPSITYQDVVVEAGPVDEEIAFIDYFFPHDRGSELHQKIDNERKLVTDIINTAQQMKDWAGALAAMATSVSTLRRYVGLQKLKPAADMIYEELESGAYEKVVIFAIHQAVIEGMRSKLQKFNPVTLYGKTPEEKRVYNIKKFQETKKCRVFIANIQAAGTAITLTAAHHVVFIEQDWTPGNNAQAAMRVHRIGQKYPVNIRFIALADSLDQKISNILKRKAKDITEIFDDDKELLLPTKNTGATPKESKAIELEDLLS